MAFLPGDRLLFNEKMNGRVRLLVGGTLVPGPVAVIDSVRTGSEAGLLGVTPDAAFPVRPYLYVLYNWSGGPFLRIVRFRLTGDLDGTGNGVVTADPSSRLVLLDVLDQNVLHNGGSLRFGPDGMLYATLGEDVQGCSAMFPDSLKGVLLRLDVANLGDTPGKVENLSLLAPADNPYANHPDPRARLVWARGFRNPWNFHHDAPGGRIFVADVGPETYEEIDLVDGAGLYFGWPAYEGYTPTGATCAVWDTAGSRAPIHVYDRTAFQNGAAIISVGLYRRPLSGRGRFPVEYEGDYFFGDVGEGFIRRLHESGGVWSLAPAVPGQPSATDWATNMDFVTDYLEASDGSLWYCRYHDYQFFTGEIRRIVYVPSTAVDDGGIRPALALEPPWPVPARGPVSFALQLPAEDRVHISVHDVAGRRVRVLLDGETLAAGRHPLVWDGRDDAGAPVTAGLYVIRSRGTAGDAARRCVIAR